jgi:hypothetical protein
MCLEIFARLLVSPISGSVRESANVCLCHVFEMTRVLLIVTSKFCLNHVSKNKECDAELFSQKTKLEDNEVLDFS